MTRGVAQLVARLVWDQEVAGSPPLRTGGSANVYWRKILSLAVDFICPMTRGVAQLVARLVWDQEVAGSPPLRTGGSANVYWRKILSLAVDFICPMTRGVAQLVARLVWDQEVAGSNPVAPSDGVTLAPVAQRIELRPSKSAMQVRFLPGA